MNVFVNHVIRLNNFKLFSHYEIVFMSKLKPQQEFPLTFLQHTTKHSSPHWMQRMYSFDVFLSLSCTFGLCTFSVTSGGLRIQLVPTHLWKASRRISLRLLTVGKSWARCRNFCSSSPKSFASSSSFTSFIIKPMLFSRLLSIDNNLLLCDFNGNEMLNTTIMNNR